MATASALLLPYSLKKRIIFDQSIQNTLEEESCLKTRLLFDWSISQRIYNLTDWQMTVHFKVSSARGAVFTVMAVKNSILPEI